MSARGRIRKAAENSSSRHGKLQNCLTSKSSKCVCIGQCCEQKRRQLPSCFWSVVLIGILNTSAHSPPFNCFQSRPKRARLLMVKNGITVIGQAMNTYLGCFFTDWCDGTCSSLHWKAAEQLDRTDPHSWVPREVKDDWSGHRYPLRLSRRPGNYQT